MRLAAIIVALVGTGVVRAAIGGLRRIRRCRIVVIWLCVVGLLVVIEGHWSRGPAGAVEGGAAGFASAARGYAGAADEEEEKTENDDDKDDPAHPVVPGRPAAVPPIAFVPAVILISCLQGGRHDGRDNG